MQKADQHPEPQRAADPQDEMRSEYDFSNAVRGKHHAAYRSGTNLVRLDADLAERFESSEAVNEALRRLLASEGDALAAHSQHTQGG